MKPVLEREVGRVGLRVGDSTKRVILVVVNNASAAKDDGCSERTEVVRPCDNTASTQYLLNFQCFV